MKGRNKEYSLISNDFVRVSRTLEAIKAKKEGANSVDTAETSAYQTLLQDTVRGDLKITSIEDYGDLIPDATFKRVRH